jgi:hypothetical protein
MEILTQHRPASDLQANVESLPAPFGQIARACLQRRITASEALQMLEGRQTAAAQPPVRVKVPMAAVVAALAAVLVLLFGVRAYRNRTVVQQPVPVVAQAPPIVTRERVIVEKPRPQPSWVLVAAIYKDHDLASKRAASIAKQWKNWAPEVYPPAGKGNRRYMVVLHRADSRKEAERLLARARAEGLPSDTYVTKITGD